MKAVLTDIRYEKVSLAFIHSQSWSFIYRFKRVACLAISDKSNQIRCLIWDSPLCVWRDSSIAMFLSVASMGN